MSMRAELIELHEEVSDLHRQLEEADEELEEIYATLRFGLDVNIWPAGCTCVEAITYLVEKLEKTQAKLYKLL